MQVIDSSGDGMEVVAVQAQQITLQRLPLDIPVVIITEISSTVFLQYECRLCLTLHNNEGNYLAHTQVCFGHILTWGFSLGEANRGICTLAEKQQTHWGRPFQSA